MRAEGNDFTMLIAGLVFTVVEVGVAIGLHKPLIIHVLDGVKWPLLLEHEQGATAQHGALRRCRYKNSSDILQIYKKP